jgi:hypothetical protein
LNDPSLLDLHCGTDRSQTGAPQEPFLKTGIFRLGQCASVDKTRSRYLFVACEEIGQPLQLFAMLAENSADVFTGRRLRKIPARRTRREWIPLWLCNHVWN